jgi:hypothetical protein
LFLGGDATADETWTKIYPKLTMSGISVLKASHHGRKTGYHMPSVKEMSPWLTITSVGEKEYDATESYRRFSKYTVSLLKAGDITITVNDEGKWYYSSNVEEHWKPQKNISFTINAKLCWSAYNCFRNQTQKIDMQKEAKARIKINDLLLKSGWRFFDDTNGKANIVLETNVKITKSTINGLGNDFEKTKNGFVDFLLLDDNCFPFVVLEAKSEDKSPLDGKEQARRYAQSQNVRFVILSNGNLHYFWDLERGV